VHGLFLKKTSTVSLSIDVRITMIRCVVYLLRIFKMFHGLMNNPVLKVMVMELLLLLYLFIICCMNILTVVSS